MKLLLLRHGATPGNLKKQYIGSTDQPLAEMGVDQARERSLSLPQVEQVWVSTMLRARQTAEIMFPDAPKRWMDSLREMDFGFCEEKTWEEINDPSIYDGWLKNDPNAAFPGGETLGELLSRTEQALLDIARNCEEKSLSIGAIVAHGGILMALMSAHGVPPKDFFCWESSNCGGFEVEFDTKTLALHLVGIIGEARIW